MPGEDKLTHAQRVRLEAFAQACNSNMIVYIEPDTQPGLPAGVVRHPSERPPERTMENLFARAEQIEAWLWEVEMIGG